MEVTRVIIKKQVPIKDKLTAASIISALNLQELKELTNKQDKTFEDAVKIAQYIVDIELYQRTGLNNDLENRYRCVCCKKPVSIRDSYSSCGHRLICYACYIKYFDDDILKAHKWMRKDKV